MNSEEVHWVHVVQWNAVGAEELFFFSPVDLVPVTHIYTHTNMNLGLLLPKLTFILFGQ